MMLTFLSCTAEVDTPIADIDEADQAVSRQPD